MAEKLRILCCNPNGGAFFYVTKGWEAAFKALGHQFERWNGTDAHLKSYKPHMYLGCSGWRQNFPKWAKDAYGTRVAIHVNPWGSTSLQPKHINEAQGAIDWVTAQNPDFLYCYGIEADIKHMWNKWESNICAVIPMPTGGDAVTYHPVAVDPKYKCDVGFVGGRWAYKAKNINKYLMPVFNKLNSQVYGWGGWPKGKPLTYRGGIEDQHVNKIFSSAKVCPSIVEPHTTTFGIDIPERMFKIPLAGGFTVLDPCAGIERLVSRDVFPIAKNPSHYLDLIAYYVKNDKIREDLKKKQRLAIMKDHTYFSRIQGFLKFGRFSTEADEAQRKVDELCSGIITS